MKELSEAELRTFNGRDGRPVYVAYKGQIYDVTSSPFWSEGEHAMAHAAGDDLTEQIQFAPHGGEMLQKFPVVGRLAHPIVLEPSDLHRSPPPQ